MVEVEQPGVRPVSVIRARFLNHVIAENGNRTLCGARIKLDWLDGVVADCPRCLAGLRKGRKAWEP